VVDHTQAPTYKMAKFLAKKLNDCLNLENYYNVKISTTLANDLTKLKIHSNYKMITFDIKDLYVNIPIHETLDITENILLRHHEKHTTDQIIALLHTILQQSYFSLGNLIFLPHKGIAMGLPISGIIVVYCNVVLYVP
jgi:hypothetical protein